jgi:hypothetical protein
MLGIVATRKDLVFLWCVAVPRDTSTRNEHSITVLRLQGSLLASVPNTRPCVLDKLTSNLNAP